MRTFTATEAKNRFGELLDATREGPVRIQKNGRDVGILVSPEQFRESGSTADGDDRMRPEIRRAHERSIAKWSKVYEALAK